MVLKFRISSAASCPKKDVITALDIYCKSVDSGSLTDTNQIKDYIWNRKNYSDEKRHMFFYLLYGQDDNVLGFSEFAYLPKNQILVLDYLCTDQRNHLLFYNFYHMAITEITNELKKSGHFIRYILTELSLKQQDGKLIDIDSNYFRHLLSNENFKLLKYPYYQPPLLEYEKEQEFNLSIKPISNENGTFTLNKEQYFSIVSEIYFSHYLSWYSNYINKGEFKKCLELLFDKIKEETLKNEHTELIELVQCHLFEDGQCPKFSAENITLPREKKRKWKNRILFLIWTILSIATFVLCVLPVFSNITTILCSFLTIIAGFISIISFKKDI